MVKPSDPDAPPRRDGWLERHGTWAEVTVGSILADHTRTGAWEVIATATAPQIETNCTQWFRVRSLTTGEEASISPRLVTTRATFLFRDNESQPPPRVPAADGEQMAMLVETLGAQEFAVWDAETGEVWCPNYASGRGHDGRMDGFTSVVDEIEHLAVCHGMDVSGLQALSPLEQIDAVRTAHGPLHDVKGARVPGRGGFPHRHVPEDHFGL